MNIHNCTYTCKLRSNASIRLHSIFAVYNVQHFRLVNQSAINTCSVFVGKTGNTTSLTLTPLMSLHVVRMEVKKLSIMATDGMSRNTLSNWVKKYKASDVKGVVASQTDTTLWLCHSTRSSHHSWHSNSSLTLEIHHAKIMPNLTQFVLANHNIKLYNFLPIFWQLLWCSLTFLL